VRYTISLKKNRDFRRLYNSPKNAAGPYVAVYVRRNRQNVNRLGITVSTKIGKAVKRNRARRRIREAYRLMEERLIPGYDIVIVARAKCLTVPFSALMESMAELITKLGAMKNDS
jgi:ribonuclease P protein component